MAVVRRDRPVEAPRSRRARAVLLVVAVVSLAIATTLVATADGELSEAA
ncbi:MAG: hypothetical protein OEW29_03130 [Acidimicrobiia bacterium]|nr:hypothetical protein [Acidimicrobiia bacterium]